ncbi:hypothetical protein, conserved [Eimeria acervulina]|uniref:EIF3F/CSN6-like C-terminal domain-containing protein n=1 Tax=Eimeria acervulina TaxID=5801 RepID=U6GG90_EIMAC|nr:hypothetical protein, conserved [Eimeria acervulina]CDI79271.1 hypothetical protein, conserved [Eimeria acervulina]
MMHPSVHAVKPQQQRQQQQQRQDKQSVNASLTKQAEQRPKRARGISRSSRCQPIERNDAGLLQQQRQQQQLPPEGDEQQQKHLLQEDLQLKPLQQRQKEKLFSSSTEGSEGPPSFAAAPRMVATSNATSDSRRSSSSNSKSVNGIGCTIISESNNAMTEVHLHSVVLLAIAAHAARIQVWQQQQQQQQQQQRGGNPAVDVVGLLLGPAAEKPDFGVTSITECAELPVSLLQHDSSSSCSSSSGCCSCSSCTSGRNVIQETVSLRQALDKALVPLGLYFFTKSPLQKKLPHALTSLLTQTTWGSGFPLLVVFDAGALGASGLHKPPTQCFLCMPSSSSSSGGGGGDNSRGSTSDVSDLQLRPVHLRIETSLMAKIAAEAVAKKTEPIGALTETRGQTSTAAAAAAAPARLQQQIEAFECCRRNIQRLIQYLEDVKSGACKPNPALMREALGVCKRLCRPEAPETAGTNDTAAAAAEAVAAAAADDEYFAALGVAGDASGSSSSSISSSVKTVRVLQQLLQQLLPLSMWGPLLQQQQGAQQSSQAKEAQQQQRQTIRLRPKYSCSVKEQETETAAMAILGKATMGLAAVHAAALEQRDAAAALKAMQQLLSAEADM